MIIWKGWGILAALVPIAILVIGNLAVDAVAGDGYWDTHRWPLALTLIAAAPLVWLIGTRLNRRPGRVLIDPATQHQVVLKPSHELFFMPCQYFAGVLVVGAILALFVA